MVDVESSNRLTSQIIGAAIEVHRILGPGLLESAYVPCLQYELAARKLRFVSGRTVPVVYKGLTLHTVYRVDLVIEEVVIVELKSVERMLPVYDAQLLTCLRLVGCPVGLLINFNVPKLADGVKRLINPRVEMPPACRLRSEHSSPLLRSSVLRPLTPSPPWPQTPANSSSTAYAFGMMPCSTACRTIHSSIFRFGSRPYGSGSPMMSRTFRRSGSSSLSM